MNGAGDAPTAVDVVHLAFGGLGGIQGVVEGLAFEHRQRGITSGAVLVGFSHDLDGRADWRYLHVNRRVAMRRRGDVGSVVQVAREVHRLRPHVVVAHTHRHLPGAWLGMLAARRRPRIVMVEHQPLALRTCAYELWSFIGLLLCSALVVLYPAYLEGYRWRGVARRLRRRIVVIPNGVCIPGTVASEGVQRDGGPADAEPCGVFTFGMACRLVPAKHVANVIRAAPHLAGERGAWRCRIAGDGPDRAPLEALVDELGVRDMVHFDGPLDTEQMDAWYAALDCYVQATTAESFGMSVFEAAAHGLPVITSDIPAIGDAFRHAEHCWVLPDNAPASIAEALHRVRAEARGVPMGRRARQVVAARFGTAVMAAAYEALFRELGLRTREEMQPHDRQLHVQLITSGPDGRP